MTRTFTFNKGQYISIDEINQILHLLASTSHKPGCYDENVRKSDRGDMSNYDIFDKKVKVTVQIFD